MEGLVAAVDYQTFRRAFQAYCKAQNIKMNSSTGLKYWHAFFAVWSQSANFTSSALLPEKRYDVIVMDPPWANLTQTWGFTEHSSYPRMTNEEIGNLPIPDLLKKDALVLMWTTSTFLQAGIELLLKWKCQCVGWAFVWLKITKNFKPVPGYGCRHLPSKCCEIVLLGRRGAPGIKCHKYVRDIIISVRREHSRKPEEFWAALDDWFGNLPLRKLEMFAREPRPGWDAWGNQVEKVKF